MFEASQHGRFQPCRQIVFQHYSNQVSILKIESISRLKLKKKKLIWNLFLKQVFRAQAGESVQKEFLVGQVHAERVEKESSPSRSYSLLKFQFVCFFVTCLTILSPIISGQLIFFPPQVEIETSVVFSFRQHHPCKSCKPFFFHIFLLFLTKVCHHGSEFV